MALLLSKLWSVTSWKEYSEDWASSVGPFNQLTEYQKSLGFTDPEDFFVKQAINAQNLANDKIANLLERVFSTKDLSEKVQFQLKKFTYQAIDFLRMNDSIIAEDVRQSQTTVNNQRLDSSLVNIDSVEGLVGAAAWRSWKLASLEKLYRSWAQTQGIEYLLDPTRFYDRDEIDHELSLIDDQIQNQQTLVDEKLAEFNVEMEEKLTTFRAELNNDPDLISNIGDNLIKNPEFISETAKQIDASLVTETYVKEYVEEKLKPKADKTELTALESKTEHAQDVKTVNEKFASYETISSHDSDINLANQKILANTNNASTLKNRVDTISSGIEKIFFHEINIAANTNFTYIYDVFLEGNGYYLLDFSVSAGGQNSTHDYNASGASILVRVESPHNIDYYTWTPGTTNRSTPEKWYILFLNFYTQGTKLGIKTFKYIDGSTLKDPIQDYTFRILAKKMSGLPVASKMEIYEQKAENVELSKDKPVKEG